MELKIKKIFFKSYILNTENQTEFIIKKNLKTYVNILSVTAAVKLFIP
mgnify:CR=1 FL=1